ncbi:conserved Plasmodium protein, unknown function [Plasmodium chabaudi chabaudi]|uniref:Uncharacterized protein n=1 Tax=Plasmodium chabaudi chabaudi TaxID=31271 RepID=A0A4V0K6G5_PLACU|nr:conserved Plasmodium protein, unknown function [Plasmodium chabaudi chabaudi]VTZ68625.1 conserved Plasmodium protein, unknown function [Plasmodium chabaudi chabaudi]|eukprot:XP_016655272.1 conserved Plasmodium protein, unknown function [Plasmodium chabaudi chabaudi]
MEVKEEFQEPKLNNFEKTFMDDWVKALHRVDEGRRCFENLKRMFQEMVRIEKEYERNLSSLCNIFNVFENESSGIKNGIIGIKKNIERRCDQIKDFVNYVEVEILNNTLYSTLQNHQNVFNYIKLDGIENSKMEEQAKNESLKYIERCAYSYESLVDSINVFHNSFYYDPIKRIELSNNCIKQYLIAKKREEEYKNSINNINYVEEKKEKRLKNILHSLESMDYKRIACLKDNVMKYLIFFMSYIRNVQYDVNMCIDIFKDIDPYKEIEEYCLKNNEINKKHNEQLIFYNNIVSWPMLIDFVDEINTFSRKNYKNGLSDQYIDDNTSESSSKNKYSNMLLSFFNMNTYKKWVQADRCTPIENEKDYNSENEQSDKSKEEYGGNANIISTGIFNDIVFFKSRRKSNDGGKEEAGDEAKEEAEENVEKNVEKQNNDENDDENDGEKVEGEGQNESSENSQVKDELKDGEKCDENLEAQDSKVDPITSSDKNMEKEYSYSNIKRLFQFNNNNNKDGDEYLCSSNYDLPNSTSSLKNIRLFFIFYLKNIFAYNLDVLSEFNIAPFFNSYNNRLIFCECLMRCIKEGDVIKEEKEKDVKEVENKQKMVSDIRSMVIFTKVILLFLDACNEYYDYWSAMYILIASENLYLEVDANEDININMLLQKYPFFSFENSNEINYTIANKGNDNSDSTFENVKTNLNNDIDENDVKKEDDVTNEEGKNMINIFEDNKGEAGIEMQGRAKKDSGNDEVTKKETGEEDGTKVDEKKKVYLYRFLYEHGLWNNIKFWETCLLIIISEIIQESILLEKLRYENKECLIKNYFFFFKYFQVYNSMINYGLSVNQIGLLLNKIFRFFNLKTDPISRKHFFQIIDIATNKNITLNYIKMGPENMNNEYKKYYMQYYNNFLNDDSRNAEEKN